MKKILILLAIGLGGLIASPSMDVNGSVVRPYQVKNEKGGFWWKVCAESTYVDSGASTLTSPATWIKSNSGWACVPMRKDGGQQPIQISTFVTEFFGSKADSSLFDVKFRVKYIGSDSVSRYGSGQNGSVSLDTGFTTINQTTAYKKYSVGGLWFPEADSICVGIRPATATHNGTCATDSTRIRSNMFILK
jgi:hypothetical protein